MNSKSITVSAPPIGGIAINSRDWAKSGAQTLELMVMGLSRTAGREAGDVVSQAPKVPNRRIKNLWLRCILMCLGFFTAGITRAQLPELPRDTSYTIHSNYVKLKKKYPFIKPIAPDLPERVLARQNVTYKEIAGRPLRLDIFYPGPESKKKHPGVLLIHGGGWSSGSKAHQVPMAQQLAKNGYVAAAVEYRLSPEAPYPAAVQDLKEALRWLRANAAGFNLDTGKIAVLGCSAGAQLASLLGVTGSMGKFDGPTAFPNCSASVQAVLNIDGIVSFIHPEADAEGTAAAKWLGGTRQTAWENWREASPLEYAGAGTPPFLFINSATPRFHAGRDDMIKILDRSGIYSEVHTLPETPHSFWLAHPWFETTLEYTRRFLDKVFDSPAIPAFPGAEGCGKYTTGGRGGRVLIVSNLNDDGPGSLRAAVSADGPRIVAFSVSGTIELKSILHIRSGDLTIAGQSAPGGGICLRNYSLRIEADNVIVRYLRFRMGDEAAQQDDALSCLRRKNIIIDHCSMSWSTDECASLYDTENLSLQWCILSESLNRSVHQKGEHGYGGIWGGNHASFHHNLLAHHTSRNPRFCGARYHHRPDWEVVDFRNNVIFNWEHNSAYGGEEGHYNMVNNYYKAGPATNKKVRNRIVNPSAPFGKFYVADNYVDGFPGISRDNWAGGVQCSHPDSAFAAKPFPMRVEIPHETAEQAYRAVLDRAGASMFRDAADTRIVAEVRSGKPGFANGIIDSQKTVGGWPDLPAAIPYADSDRDGMPDHWEQSHGLDPNRDDSAMYTLDKAYTNVEMYLNGLTEKN